MTGREDTVVAGFLPAGVLVLPGAVTFDLADDAAFEADFAEALLAPLAPSLATSTSLEFRLDLTGVDPALLALLFGLDDPDADAAVAEAWASDAWATWENEGGAVADDEPDLIDRLAVALDVPAAVLR